MKIGRLKVVWVRWFQTDSVFYKVMKVPFIPIILVWRREPDVTKMDRKQRYPLGTPFLYKGRMYRYFQKASDDVKKGKVEAEAILEEK